MTEMVHGTAPVRDGEPILTRWWRTVDLWSLSCLLGLVGLGVLLSFAATPPLAERFNVGPFHFVERQVVFAAAAMAVLFGVSLLRPQQVRRVAIIGFVIAFVALVLVPFFGGAEVKGATRWFRTPFGTLQPSEFVKPTFIVVSAWLIAAAQEPDGPPGRLISFVGLIVIVGLLAFQPDFGQAALVLFGWGVMWFVGGAPMALVLGLGALVIGAGCVAYEYSSHFASRIDSYLSGEIEAHSQLEFATNAIREGGYFGVGVGAGTQKWSLPDAHTDYIIAVAAEEYGLVLVWAIITLYVVVVLRSLLRLLRERDPFYRLAGTGLVALFGAQAMINLGVAVRLLPTKGMTLPFISHGGSSMLAMGLSLGMLLVFTSSRPQGKIGEFLRGRHR